MGNCNDQMFSQPEEKIKVITSDGGEYEFMASTPVEKIASGPYHGYHLVHHANPNSPLPPNSRLIAGEVYLLVPPFLQALSDPRPQKMVGDGSCGGQSIKILLTKQQLETLLRNGAMSLMLQSKEIAVQFSFGSNECPKWRPSLATILELQNC